MATFQPKSEAEVSPQVLPAGVYDAEIRECVERTRDKTGAPMFLIKLVVYDAKGEKRWLNDCVLTDAMEHKLRHLCYSAGIGELYEQGNVTEEDLIGRSCRIKTGTEDSPGYGLQAKVKDYVLANGAPKATYTEGVGNRPKQAPIGTEADIPF